MASAYSVLEPIALILSGFYAVYFPFFTSPHFLNLCLNLPAFGAAVLGKFFIFEKGLSNP
jgi:hypothetical protein